MIIVLCFASSVVIAQQPRTTPQAQDQNMVLAAQVMLDSAGYSPGEIDGRAGANFGRAVAAYQQSRGLDASGRVDDATFDRLRQDFRGQPPVVVYTLADIDVAGPFQADIPKDLVAQSKLPSLDYRNPLEAIAEKFHASPALLQSLNPGQTFTDVGSQITVPNVMPSNPLPGPGGGSPRLRQQPRAPIVVTKKTSTLDGRRCGWQRAVLRAGDDRQPARSAADRPMEGDRRPADPAFHYNPDLFWDAEPEHSKAKIPAGPNNPVGVAWIDLNKPHYGIHGTPEPSQVGHMQSHGCVRMTNWDVRRVMEWARPGTLVVFQ